MITEQKLDNNLTKICFEFIQKNIIEGLYKPGQKLKIVFLKKELGTGQSPIREALSRLTQTGLVEATENKGFSVSHVSEEEVRDLYRAYFELEMTTLRLAMQHGDDAWEASIVSTLYQLSLVENNPSRQVSYNEWMERNAAFHFALIAGCKSPHLLALRAQIYQKFDRYCRLSFYAAQEELHLNHEEHSALAKAVLKRDQQQVTALLTHHIFGSLETVIQSLKTGNFFS